MIPIFKAKKIEKDEYIIGWYSDTLFLCMGDIKGHYIAYKKLNAMNKEITLQESIEPATLSVSFNNGKSFIKCKDLKMRDKKEKEQLNKRIGKKMKINWINLKETFVKNKMFFIGVLISTLFFLLVKSYTQYNALVEDYSSRMQYLNKELGMSKIIGLNLMLEKLDYAAKEKQKIELADESQRAELISASTENIKNKFREVHYKKDNSGQVIELDFSDLNISCATYLKFLPTEKLVLPDAKYINKNCEEVK